MPHIRRDFQVVQTDNFGRETVADTVIVDHITEHQAERITEILRENCTESSSEWYVTKHKDTKLSMGMADFI